MGKSLVSLSAFGSSVASIDITLDIAYDST